MPRKKQQDETVQNIDQPEVETSENTDVVAPIVVSLGASNNETRTSASSLVGKVVSLNKTRESYFGIGDIWLTPVRYWAKISDKMSPEHLAVIANAIRRGTLVLGKQNIAPIERYQKTKDDYAEMVLADRASTNGVTKKLTRTFGDLLRAGSSGGWSVSEIVNYCIVREERERNRPVVIKFLKEVLKNYDGPISLILETSEEEGKKVTIDPRTKKIIGTNSESAKYVASARPPSIPAGGKSAEQALKDLLD